MEVNSAKENISGLACLLQGLDLQSGVGCELLARSHWYGKGEEAALLQELSRVEKIKDLLCGGQTAEVERLKRKFSQVLDIRGTFGLIGKGDVDDVQLFEVKRFSLLAADCAVLVSGLIRACAFKPAPENFPDLSGVVSILDPRNEKLPAFYIYDEYHPLLAQKRKKIQELAKSEDEAALQEAARLQEECAGIEYEVRCELSRRLSAHVEALQTAMRLVAYWDLQIAKTYMAFEYGMVLPDLQATADAGKLRYKGLFHPVVKRILEEKGHRYQSIDISLQSGASLFTGANMSGKTVLLKSLALAQCLLQFGFPVPAQEAHMVLFDRVELLVQDNQDEERGLSSFGAEMQRLNRILRELRGGTDMLLLIDELARTTNPTEGKAIVCAVLDALKNLPCVALVSTHYGPIPNALRRLRVRGFREDWMNRGAKNGVEATASTPGAGAHFELSRIQSCMDYSVEEEHAQSVPPAEALRIAGLLGFDAEVLAVARKYYENNIS
ncbi:MAG: hypothetical protein NC324_03605 [Bacteroides sp.]|nr:hypothetical protein [Bacteroides sp.]